MDAEQVAEKLVSWIRDKVLAGGSRGVVFGLSGGLDSAVLAVLCHRAFPQATFGVVMPCYSRPEDKEYALMVAQQFALPTEMVVLDEVFDAFRRVLPSGKANPEVERLAEANLKVRLRMMTLYYFANRRGYMVAGSGNRSELSVGYFTKYGDGGVDIMPLGSLVKSQVRELAGFLGIPGAIIDKPPSAGLWPGQTDEAELGFSYAELDRYLLCGEASDELRQRIETMIDATRHKRQPPPLADF